MPDPVLLAFYGNFWLDFSHNLSLPIIPSLSLQGKTIGTFQKDKFPGDFMDSWWSTIGSEGIEKVLSMKY